ncbi:MAG: prepilin-type N-terminal cleavage/methylation domain-containing protein [Candidatus Gracilibacteria bacterium]|nr:prepilin-type N-terminal cleavage/methylation domain-containing protein [Candidatus Gracilibacteria bacterium]
MKTKEASIFLEVPSSPFLSQTRKTKKHSHGFTLIELIVVITILVILGTIAFVNLGGFQSSARDGRRVSDMANIGKAIDLIIIQQGSAPIPTSAVSYTGGSVTLQMGTVTSTTIPRMNGDFRDPLTQSPYNYSVFGNGSYYQIGIDFENPLSYHTSIPGIDTVYAADSSLRYSKLSGNYVFDPSLPSLFVLSGSYNTASGGIFAPDVCFVLDNVSTNTFGSSVSSVTSSGCIAKKDMSLNTLDRSLVGYWDMETLTSSGLLKDLSGNGWNGKCYNSSLEASSGSCQTIGPKIISGGMVFNGSGQNIKIVNSTGILAGEKQMTMIAIVNGNCTTGNCVILRGGGTSATVKSLNYPEGKVTTEVSVNNSINNSIWPVSQNDMTNYNSFITATYDGNKIKVYKNAKNIGERSSNGIISNSTWDWCIGKMLTGGDNTFSGTISELKIYNRALSDEEIRQQARITGF